MDRVKLDRAFNLAAAYSHDYWIWTFGGKFSANSVLDAFSLELGRVEIRGLNLVKRGTRFTRVYYEWRSAFQKLVRKVVPETKTLLFVPEFRCTDHFEDIKIACR